MNWFLTRPKSQTDHQLAEEQALLEHGTANRAAPVTDEPALLLLAQDAHGPACRRLHCFADAEAAKEFVKFWYPYRSEEGVLGFWLLVSEPLPADKAEWDVEVLIMIRDLRPGIVFAFSKHDMDAAREFLLEEAGYGLNLADVLLFWAVPVQIENDFRGDTLLFPSTMPEGAAAGHKSVTALDEREMATALALNRR